ncbi:hypothetical protein GMOD_00007023 [Pyrenophora seminiperda CCB06]|uniref:Myb transcription factor n=1 Tax=Pyrenophora seminiperda CCB06 TaxID=1302712 RepID=A0A3M7MCE3_9PLEO|nr:hypothetical protein GMOD_00007023 [Pyrenophora seminiperda CCB06]
MTNIDIAMDEVNNHGYTLFTQLRQSMGTTTSAPTRRPSDAFMVASPTTLRRESHSSPKMDDVAASQQLIDESARGDVGNDEQLDGTDNNTSPKRTKRKRRSTRKSTDKLLTVPTATQDPADQDTIPESSPFPFPATQPDIQPTPRPNYMSLRKAAQLPAFNGLTSSPTVEVPDSQMATSAAPERTSSPTLDFVVPSSATKGKRTYKKSKRSMQERLSREVALQSGTDQDGNAAMGADESDLPSYTLSNRKRSRTEKAKPDFSGVEGEGITPSNKRQRIAKSKHATTVQDLLQGNQEHSINGIDNEDERLLSAKKSKLKRVKKPRTSVVRIKNVYDIPSDELPTPNGADEAGGADDELRSNADAEAEATTAVNGFAEPRVTEEVDLPEETPIRKPRVASRKNKENDRPAPVRKPSQSPSVGIDNEETILREPDSSDDEEFRAPASSSGDEIPHRRPDNGDQTVKKNRKRKTKTRPSNASVKEADTPGITPKRKRRRSGKFDGTPAENALHTIRDLNQPPVLRRYGEFTEDEEELIRRAIVDYQQRNDLDVSELVHIIQWCRHDPSLYREDHSYRMSNWSSQDRDDSRESQGFWEEIEHINMQRPLEERKKYIRRVYHCFKSGSWSEEEDEQLRKLVAEHPSQWKVVSIKLGTRSMQDCQNRWRDYLEYGENRNTSRWKPEEEELLVRAVNTVAQRDEDLRAATGKPRIDPYTSRDIHWPQVSHEMGDIRSRIQASVKWSKLLKREDPPEIQVEYKPRKFQALATPKSTKKSRQSRRSDFVIQSSDGEGQSKPAVSNSTTKKPRKSRMSKDKNPDPEPEEARTDESSNESPQKKKPRGRSRKSGDSEVVKPKKRGRPRKSEIAEAEQPDEHRTSKTSQEDSEELGQDEVPESAQEDEPPEDNVQEESSRDDREEDSPQEENLQAEDRQRENSPDESSDEESLQNKSPDAENAKAERTQEGLQEEMPETQSIRENTPTQEDEEMSVEDQVTPVATTKNRSTKESGKPEETTAPGVDQMRWGDKYDLISKLQERRDEDETAEDVDWDEVANILDNVWTPQTLQTALRQLVQLLHDQGKDVDEDDYPGTVDDIMDMICSEHGEELEDHYTESVQALGLSDSE